MQKLANLVYVAMRTGAFGLVFLFCLVKLTSICKSTTLDGIYFLLLPTDESPLSYVFHSISFSLFSELKLALYSTRLGHQLSFHRLMSWSTKLKFNISSYQILEIVATSCWRRQRASIAVLKLQTQANIREHSKGYRQTL